MPRRPLSFWLAFAAFALLFELPSLLWPGPWRPSGDALLLATAWLLAARAPRGVWLQRGVVAVGLLLVAHRLDRLGFVLFMGDEPLLYDQLFLLRHLVVLIGDVWSTRVALAVVAVVVAIAGATWLVRRLLAALVLPAEPQVRRRLLGAGAALWALAAIGTMVGEPRAVQWQSAALLGDVMRSARIYASVQRRIGASPYAQYDAIALRRKPDVHLLFVESYGRVMVEHPEMRPRWTAQIERMQDAMEAGGWHAVSGFSRAPIMGGRSWLSEASLLTGMRVAYQAVFHHLVSQIDRVPHLVAFLEKQGYTSLLLGPADRPRPGVREVNYYGYDRQLRFHDLQYTGPRMGWGLVPDQYSLGFAHEHVLARARGPMFFNFHMVSSHAPWEFVPELVRDWRTLNDWLGPRVRPERGSRPEAELKRFVRSTRSFARLGELHADFAARYVNAIVYELSVVQQHLDAVQRDALVIVIGDHQPPFLAAETRRFDTPVHVFARDPALLAELREHGFRDGLQLDPEQTTTTAHEALFSLVVRALARCCASVGALPAHHVGVALGGE